MLVEWKFVVALVGAGAWFVGMVLLNVGWYGAGAALFGLAVISGLVLSADERAARHRDERVLLGLESPPPITVTVRVPPKAE